MDANTTHEIFFVPQQFPTIQAAVDAITGPATIVVAPGLYAETIHIVDKPYAVIQSAQLSRRGVTISGDGGLAVLFIERSTLHLSGIEVRSNARSRGILVISSSISLQECVIAGNRVGNDSDELFGVGMFCRKSKVRIQKSTISGNVVDGGAAAIPAGGGGLFFQNCQVEIAGSTIQANAVYTTESARGGGIWCEQSTLRMWRSRVTDNALHAELCEGAGIYFKAALSCQLNGSVITGNGSPQGYGGGVFINGDSANVVIHRNTVVRQNHPTDIEYRIETPESIMNLEACLPVEIRGSVTTITPVAAGLSGAGVYRVEAAGQVFVLKISREGEPLARWPYKLYIQQLAADAGLAPRIVHVDETRRAILSDFIVDQSFPALYWNPRTHETALAKLGRTLRRVHELPLPPGANWNDPREFLAAIWSEISANFALPAFVRDAVQRVLSEEVPVSERALVLSHNDVNPSNLIYDGENLLLLDWETAGPNDPFYDLAAISIFARMDEGTCQKLLAVYDDKPVSELPARFVYTQRLVAILCGTLFLRLAYNSGYAGATGEEMLDSVLSLGEFYQHIQSGSLNVATGEGQWWFGLALMKTGVML
jgi:thiamine kinase-like enzyme